MPVAVKQHHILAQPFAAGAVSVATAKANLSSLLNAVEQKHTAVTILRRGVPIAQIVPFPQASRQKLSGSMAGTLQIHGDIVSSVAEEWTVSDWPETQTESSADDES